MRGSSHLLLVAMLGAACSRSVDLTAPGLHSVRGVEISIVVPGTCLLTCDPVQGDHHTLGLVRIVNTGSRSSYLQTCGLQAMLVEQQFVVGQWVNAGPAITCPVTPRQISLASGDSIRVNWFFASGRSRIVLGVASRSDLGDEEVATSAAIDVP